MLNVFVDGLGADDIAIYDVEREMAEKLFKLSIFSQDSLEKDHEECEGCEECNPYAYYE